MEGPFQLADSVINAVINNTGPAVFLLRRIEETPKYAHYRAFIGRTDGNLAETLKGWLGSDYRYNFGTGCHKPFSPLLIAERSATTRFHIGSIKKVQQCFRRIPVGHD